MSQTLELNQLIFKVSVCFRLIWANEKLCQHQLVNELSPWKPTVQLTIRVYGLETWRNASSSKLSEWEVLVDPPWHNDRKIIDDLICVMSPWRENLSTPAKHDVIGKVRPIERAVRFSDLSSWRLRGSCVPPGRRSPGGAARWGSCWPARSSWRLRSCSCWRRRSCSPLPVAGQAAGVEQTEDRARHMTGLPHIWAVINMTRWGGWPGSLALDIFRLNTMTSVLRAHVATGPSPLNINKRQVAIYTCRRWPRVTARRTKIVPSAHVHAGPISCTSWTSASEHEQCWCFLCRHVPARGAKI